MINSNAFRLQVLLVGFMVLSACGEDITGPVTIVNRPAPEPEAARTAPSFEGAYMTRFAIGSMQSVSYYVEHPDGEEVAVEVLSLPEGASYVIYDAGSTSRKQITISWNPDYSAAGDLHLISLAASSASGESRGAFEIYVQPVSRELERTRGTVPTKANNSSEVDDVLP